MEYEAVVVRLSSREALRVHHELQRVNPLTHRGGNTRTGGRGRPHSETSRDHSGGNGKQGDLAHLSSPVQSALKAIRQSATCQAMAFGRCDGHHEMVDFRLMKNRCPPK